MEEKKNWIKQAYVYDIEWNHCETEHKKPPYPKFTEKEQEEVLKEASKLDLNNKASCITVNGTRYLVLSNIEICRMKE